MDKEKPIRGRFVFDDGTELPFTKGRYVNGVERRIVCIEVDGVRYVSEKDEEETGDE